MGLSDTYIQNLYTCKELSKENPITTTTGKRTSRKSTNFVSLVKEVNVAELSRVTAWHAIYLDSKDFKNVAEYARLAVREARGKNIDIWKESTIAQQISTIAWAVENLLGGPKEWKSMGHIKASKAKPKMTVKDTTNYKVRTISGSDLVKELVANGVERKTALIIAKNMRFA